MRSVRRTLIGLVLAAGLLPAPALSARSAATPKAPAKATYRNSLNVDYSGHTRLTNCADPAVIHGQKSGDTGWYVYCTSEVLNAQDAKVHLIPILSSQDLVHWKYVGDALSSTPGWVHGGSPLQTPDIRYFNNRYYLYYAAPDTTAGGNAIGVLTSPNPMGPWTDSGAAVVEPHAPPCCAYDKMSVYGPSVIDDGGQRFIFYGSFFGGIQVRKLSADGLHSDPASQTQITIDNAYGDARVVKHAGYFYLLLSATNCCNGPLTGYSVFAGRSPKILGPYVDRSGHSLLDSRMGSTPVISMNGNRWVGPGHSAIFTDFSGRDWVLYSAIDRNHPYLTGGAATRHDERQLLLDALDWINGWPSVRGGYWASDSAQPAPAARAGSKTTYKVKVATWDKLGAKLPTLSDDFTRPTLGPQWRWVRPPPARSFGVEGGTLRLNTAAGDLYLDATSAPVLLEATPGGNYAVEIKVKLSVPRTGCCFNYAQAGLVIYRNDDNFVKLTHTSNWNTRLTEFAKQMTPASAGYPRYGNTQVGPPGDWTWLRIVKRTRGKDELYRAYTSADGTTWERGGVWKHRLGSGARIGLVAMGAPGFTAHIGYVHVFSLSR